MPLWFPVLDHASAGQAAWHEADRDGHVRRADGHPRGAAIIPTFTIAENTAYTTGYGTTRGAGIAWFTIVGSMIYAADGHPFGPSPVPRYQSRG